MTFHKLGETFVSTKQLERIQQLRKKGGKLHLLLPELWDEDHAVLESSCANCRSTGQIGLEIIVGGPSKVPFQTTPYEREKNKQPIETTTTLGESYYKRIIEVFTCPICHGSGNAAEQDLIL